MKTINYLLKLLLLTAVLSACAPVTSAVNTEKSPVPIHTDQPQSTIIPTLEPIRPAVTPTIENLHVTITVPPLLEYKDGGGSNVITLDYNNQLITLHPNETFLLKLGEIYNWDWQIDNQAVASREINIAVIKGAQGVIKAHQPGVANLTATGDPMCRTQKPACGMPSILFSLHIEVLP